MENIKCNLKNENKEDSSTIRFSSYMMDKSREGKQ